MARLSTIWHRLVTTGRRKNVHCAVCENPIPAGRRYTCSDECAVQSAVDLQSW